jgi:carbon monoxide dehydrogenase subunit G
MAEKLVNEFTVNRPIDEAWVVITDVERIAPCLPGAQLQEIEGDVYRGIVKVKLGSISPQFKGQAKFTERDDAAHQATLDAEGRDTGGRGNASARINVEAESLSPTSTKVMVTTDLQITGKVAQFGRGIIGDVSKKLMEQFANNLNSMLDSDPVASNGAAESAPAPTDGDATDDSPNAAPDSAATATGAASATDEAGEVPVTPRVRKIEGPATEPVDLAGVAGPAVLKRLLPIVAGLLVLLFILRRRR